MAYNFKQSSKSSAGGFGGGAGGYGQGGFGGEFGQGAGGFGQAAGGYGQAAGGYGHGGGAAYGQGSAGGFGGGGGGFGAGFGGGADAGYGGGECIFSANEKQTMQNLNDRLAAYLDKVKQLEAENADYEQKIKEFLEKQRSGSSSGGAGKDYSKYFTTIADLQSKIIAANNDNAHLVLQTDNARLAADDFKMKYENELALRRSVEADINGLRKVLDDLTMSKSDLESQLEGLIEELALLKKNHQEEVSGSQGTSAGEVNVELNAVPGNDLLKEMNNLREQYEAMAEKNRKEAEEQFKKASDGLKKEISAGVEQIQTSKSEISDLRKTLQALEIELQSQLAMKKSLEETLAQTEGQYCMKLSQIQQQIAAIEEQLSHIREEIECQTAEYEDLLDIKTKLENEIETYRRLLDGEGGSGKDSSGSGAGSGSGSGATKGSGSTSGSTSGSQGTKRTKKIKEIEEVYENGKVIATRVKEREVPIDSSTRKSLSTPQYLATSIVVDGLLRGSSMVSHRYLRLSLLSHSPSYKEGYHIKNMSYSKTSASSRHSVGGGNYGTAICSFLGSSGATCGGGSFGANQGGSALGGFGGGSMSGGAVSGFGGFGGGSMSGGAVGGFSAGSFGGTMFGGDGLLSGSEKETMQNLNDRLASYLDKVRELEEANAELECKIKAWYEKHINDSKQVKDYSKYYQCIEDLKKQIQAATVDNARIVLQIDNSRLAADDFKLKFENEMCLRQNVEADINGLRKVLDDLSLSKCDLESQIEGLTEEIVCLKKNHEEEMKSFQGVTGQLTVEMNATPGNDLTKILNDMRSDYEYLAEKNRKDAEAQFNEASRALKQEISSGVEQIQSSTTEITDLKRSVQALEIELQAALATKKSLESSLAETEGNYCEQLGKIQEKISCLEEQMCEVRTDMERQGLEYDQLLDIKSRLEKEIETYRCLLDGQSISSIPPQTPKEPQKVRKIRTIVEEVVDGKTVSQQIKEREEKV
ncbi:uncharacterized protein ACMZJ9_017675 [Mantella aurantiaca]